jgi:hypothetical protein
MYPSLERYDLSFEEINDHHVYFCAFCGEENEVLVDASGDSHQRFTEDCEVCCRPNLLDIAIGHDGFITVQATQEYEA